MDKTENNRKLLEEINLKKVEMDAYNFAKKYPGWHSFSQDKITIKAIKNLVAHKLVEVNEYDQFRLVNQ